MVSKGDVMEWQQSKDYGLRPERAGQPSNVPLKLQPSWLRRPRGSSGFRFALVWLNAASGADS